uniref:Kazal-like domain-containing protein n=1 Tax=Strix occidentalis caurina TaxID=311401 RepID=A0A8D0F4L5_STROC
IKMNKRGQSCLSCNNDYVPVCGSNGDTYQNECYLKQAACKQQSEILLVSEGSCATGTYNALQAACGPCHAPE